MLVTNGKIQAFGQKRRGDTAWYRPVWLDQVSLLGRCGSPECSHALSDFVTCQLLDDGD